MSFDLSFSNAFEQGLKEIIENTDATNSPGEIPNSTEEPPLSTETRVLPCSQDELLKNILQYYATGTAVGLEQASENDDPELPHIEGRYERRRAVFREWPRKPKGKTIALTPQGRLAPNGGHLWGATLFDFYHILRNPETPGFVTCTTSSVASKWMIMNGEMTAKDELEWAAKEEPPTLRERTGISELLIAEDREVFFGGIGQKRLVDRLHNLQSEPSSDPFHVSNYPPPYPLLPFSYSPSKLQTTIKFHLLPKKLIVHDPWNLLAGKHLDGRSKTEEFEWVQSTVDIPQVYRLELSKAGLKRVEEDSKSDIKKSDRIELLCDFPEGQDGMTEPAIIVTVPAPPPPPSSIPEAHLYLSPLALSGTGHHSVVYEAEWEIPRSIFDKPTICHECVMDAAEDILDHGGMSFNVGSLHTTTGNVPPTNIQIQDLPTIHQITPRENVTHSVYMGPVEYVHVNSVPWNQKQCKHLAGTQMPAPLTARFKVIAKLSKPNIRYGGPIDTLLREEGETYQQFSKHLSEAWTGYSIVHPMQDPTPLHATVPQFYGYYTKVEEEKAKDGEDEATDEEDEAEDEKEEEIKYSSDILLIEDCGVPIDIDQLNYDERQECASLVLRFHNLGWLHDSLYHRNIVVQTGDPVDPSIKEKRFRLIDFGRSVRSEDVDSKKDPDRFHRYVRAERTQLRELFDLNWFPL